MPFYKVIHKIGSGAFGNVYLLQVGPSKQLALKTVNTERFQRDNDCYSEGKLMLKLSHSHLVHCYDAFLCGSFLYLVMELCSRGSLENHLCKQKYPLPELQICTWITQIADVLRYLHALKVIHRDIKPANVFLDSKENIKLGDLGVARELDHTAQERHTAAGTLPYMSPEAFTGMPYNYKTDIWSMGCCIHESMTLNKTFQGRGWSELYHMITSASVPPMPSVYSNELKRLVLSLLNPDPHQRPDALEILHALSQIQGKKFSTRVADSTPILSESFDQRRIHEAVREFGMSCDDGVILPLGDEPFDDVVDSQRHQVYSGTVKAAVQTSHRGDSDERNSGKRLLPLPKHKKKKNILKTLQNPDTDTIDTPKQNQRLDTKDTINSMDQFVDDLAKDSIHWLRERFAPHNSDVRKKEVSSSEKIPEDSRSEANEMEEEEDEDVEETAGLVTLFTQAQTAVFIHTKSHDHVKTTDENLP